MFGLFKKTPKLEASFAATTAIARELAKEIEVAGELLVRNVGKDAEFGEVDVVLVAGGTRRIDLALPKELSGTVRIPAGGTLKVPCNWKITLAAPMRAPHCEVQVQSHAGGKITPLCFSNKFDLDNV
jgi:hypothetical protein